MKLNYRNPKPEDAEQIAGIFFERMEELKSDKSYDQIKKIVETEINRIPLKYCFVAEEDGKIVGHIFTELLTTVWGFRPTIWYFAVKKDMRNKGIGTKLIDLTLSVLKKNGHDCAMLEVLMDNTTAIKLYEDLGFEKTKYLMKKNL